MSKMKKVVITEFGDESKLCFFSGKIPRAYQTNAESNREVTLP
jgi:hypothetical protein